MKLKKPLTIDEQIDKLISHGIIVDDREMAKEFLRRVSYYRLTGYTLQFRKKPSTSELLSKHDFKEIKRLYDFDEQLRCLIRLYIEIIEVFYKTHISNTFALEKCLESPHDQHYDEENYYNKDGFRCIIERFEKEKQYYADSLIVKHHKQNYAGRMPIWVMFELMSFSNVSMLYSAMYETSQDRIAQSIGVGRKTLANHLHCMAILRNRCAHAARLINTRYNPPAKMSAKFLRNNPNVNNDTLFAYLIVLVHRLPSDSLRIDFKNDLFKLLDKYNDIDFSLMGFPSNYKSII